MAVAIRRWLIGRPLETHRAAHEKLPKVLALPVFASDALSSVAYATGEIMAALLLSSTVTFHLTFPISIAIATLLAIVTISYRQTVLAYPGGGGAYIVARDNLGVAPAQAAGAALLIDYILTVAVSVSAGVDAIRSLLYNATGTHINAVPVCIAILAVITIVNLRGVKDSGVAFALPTYAFITIVYIVIATGLWHYVHHSLGAAHPFGVFENARPGGIEADHFKPFSDLTRFGALFLILRAFASGCAALTGVEAISNGVTAFKQPASRNAATTMLAMSMLLGTMFIGLSFLAVHVHALPETAAGVHETVISQVGRVIIGRGPMYYWLQIATALILVLAANTSFADFPRLGALQARDGFLPKQLSNIGDRLVYDRGIVTLGVLSGLLIIAFRGDTHLLIPLYAVGVFLSFTLSQAGMVKRWRRLRTPGWRWKAVVNGLGAVATAIVLVVFGAVKFVHGAWVVIVLIPTLMVIFFRIHAHYRSVDEEQDYLLDGRGPKEHAKHAVLVLIPGVTRGAVEAVEYAESLAGDCRAIYIEVDPDKTPQVREAWMKHCDRLPLVILESPFRTVVAPLMAYLDEAQRETPNTKVTVVIPELATRRWWQSLLHGHTGFLLKLALLRRENLVVTNVRYHLRDEKLSLREIFDVTEEYAGHL